MRTEEAEDFSDLSAVSSSSNGTATVVEGVPSDKEDSLFSFLSLSETPHQQQPSTELRWPLLGSPTAIGSFSPSRSAAAVRCAKAMSHNGGGCESVAVGDSSLSLAEPTTLLDSSFEALLYVKLSK